MRHMTTSYSLTWGLYFHITLGLGSTHVQILHGWV